MARLVVKNGRQKDTFYYDIGLCGQNVSAILGSILNTTGGKGGCVITKKKESSL
jgi:hypothetical protein